jgi:ABC-type amino acid transport substrate-binding protein
MQLAQSGSHRGRRGATARLLSGALAPILLLVATAVDASALTLDRVRDTGSLRLGYRQDARPFSYQDESGKAAGYSLDLCQKVADAVKEMLKLAELKIELVPLGVEESLEAVHQGKIDLLCGATTVTLGRREQVDFSIPVFPSGIGVLVREDAPAAMRTILSGEPQPYQPRWRASLSQVLRKRVFNVRSGTTAQTWVAQKLKDFDIIAETVPVEDYAVGVQNVVDRKADALLADRALLLDAAARSPAAKDLVVLPRTFTYEPLALAMERGDADFRLLVDRTLSELYRSDGFLALYKSFFGEPDEQTLSFFRMTALLE